MSRTKNTAAPKAAQAKPCPNPAAKPQVSSTLPTLEEAGEFFDRLVLGPDAAGAQPCPTQAPAPASHAQPAAETGALPTVQQAIRLALMTVQWSLRGAHRTIREDYDGDEATAPHASILELVLAHLDGIATAAPVSWDDCDGPWWRSYEATRLVARALDKGDCTAQRYLDGAIAEFEALAGAVGLLEDRQEGGTP